MAKKKKSTKSTRTPRRVGTGYPPKAVRVKTIETISNIDDNDRTRDQWCTLGHLMVYEGCLQNDRDLINQGCASLRKAAQWNPPDPEAALELVWVFQLLGIPSMALDYAKIATDLLPQFRDSWRFRAGVHASLGERPEAIECMERAVGCKDCIPADMEYLDELKRGDRLSVAGESVTFGIRGLGSLENQVSLDEEQLALLCFELEQALKGTPDSEDFRYALARCRYSLGQLTEARKNLALLLDLNPGHADALVLKGVCLQKQQQEEAAEVEYRQALAVDPQHCLANTNLAYLLLENSQHLEGRRYLEQALKTNPNYPPALSLYGNTVAELEQDYVKELGYQKRALAQEPTNPRYILNVCLCAAQTGNFSEAQKVWKTHRSKVHGSAFEAQKQQVEVLLFPPDDGQACGLLLEHLMATPLRGPALSLLLKKLWALRFNIDDESYSDSMHGLGVYSGQCNELDLSLKFFEEAHRVSNRPGESIFNVAVALGKLGRYDEALEKIQSTGNFSTPRAYTVSGNLKRDAGRLHEALEDYRVALNHDAEFPLLYSVGSHLANELGRPDVLREFLAGLEANSDVLGKEARSIRAWCLMWLGFPSKAAQAFLTCSGVCESEPDECVNEDDTENDFSLFGDETQQQLDRGLYTSLLRSGQFNVASNLATMRRSTLIQNGDCDTVSAEAWRHSGEYSRAQQLIAGSSEGPHRLSRALCLAAENQVDEARLLLEGLADGSGDHWWHPEGELSVVAGVHMVRLNWLESRIDFDVVVEKLVRCAEVDPSFVLTYQLLVEMLAERGDHSDSMRWLETGLRHRVGDPELLRHKISSQIDVGNFEEAGHLLDANRVHFQEYGRNDLGHLLKEELLVAELLHLKRQQSDIKELESSASMPWFESLHLKGQQWLTTVLQYLSKINDLRTGICLYLCKTAETELFHRLIEPFRQTLQGRFPASDNAQRDLSRYVVTGQGTMGLGGCHRSLLLVASQQTSSDSQLLKLFRAYVRGLDWPEAAIFLTDDYLAELGALARTRNRMAHQDDIAEAEFTRVFKFLIDGNRPGQFFRAFGLE